MKKLSILALLLAILVVIGCACDNGSAGGSETDPVTDPVTDPATDPVTEPPVPEKEPLNAVIVIDAATADTYTSTGNPCIPFDAAVETLDLSANLEKGALSLWLYIEDVAAIKDPVSVEFCSGGAADKGEFCYNIPVADLLAGWNQYVINFADFGEGTSSDASVTANWEAINYIRVFTLANDGTDATMKVGRLGIYSKKSRAEGDIYKDAYPLKVVYTNPKATTASLSGVNEIILPEMIDLSTYARDGIWLGSWIYVDDVAQITGDAQFEFNGSAKCDDANEIGWQQSTSNCATEIVQGWNLLTFEFAYGNVAGEASYSTIDYVRSYFNAGAGLHRLGEVVIGTEEDVMAYQPSFLTPATTETDPPAEG